MRSTLSDANEQRDWRIYADFAQALIRIARPLYAEEDLGLELDNTVYALDASTIDLCLSVFPWALFRSTNSVIKLHTLLDLRGNIPSFKNTQLSEQQLRHPCADSSRPVLLPPAGGTVLQMDQTAPAHQIIFRHVRECGEDSDMERNLRLCVGCHHQEATQSQHRSLHNFTDLEPHPFRKRPFGTNACKQRLQNRRVRYG